MEETDSEDIKGDIHIPSDPLAVPKQRDLRYFVNAQWISFELSTDDCESVMQNQEFGSFVIHPNSTSLANTDLILSVKKNKQEDSVSVEHFKITREEGKFKIKLRKALSFSTLTELVQSCTEKTSSSIVLKFSIKKNIHVNPWISDNVVELECIGHGAFGTVYRGKLKNQGTIVLKQLKIENEDALLKEAKIGQGCYHPNVLRPIGICTTPKSIIYEYLSGSDLKNYLQVNEISASECKSVARNIACGMNYLENMDIIHRDLAARNIIVGESIEIIKIADFGLSREIDKSSYYISEDVRIPIKWTAPEGLITHYPEVKPGKTTHQSDVWSYGIVLWEIFSSGKAPYEDIDTDQLFDFLTEEEGCLKQPLKCPNVMYKMMRKCWKINPKDRPTFAHILSSISDIHDDEIAFPFIPEITLISSDNQMFNLGAEMHMQCGKFHSEIFDFSETVVHSDISSNVLEMLIIWLGDHKSDTTNASKLKYLKISQCDMILATRFDPHFTQELLSGAQFLNIKRLVTILRELNRPSSFSCSNFVNRAWDVRPAELLSRDSSILALPIDSRKKEELSPFENFPWEVMWKIIEKVPEAALNLRLTSRKLNFHIEGYSKQKPDLLVEKVMLDVKDTNNISVWMTINTPQDNMVVFEHISRKIRAPKSMTQKIFKNEDNKYAYRCEMKLDDQDHYLYIKDCIGGKIGRVQLRGNDYSTFSKILDGIHFSRLDVLKFDLSPKGVQNFDNFVTNRGIEQLKLIVHESRHPHPVKVLYNLSSRFRSLHICQGQVNGGVAAGADYFFGLHDVDWGPVFLEMLSRQTDKLLIENTQYNGSLSSYSGGTKLLRENVPLLDRRVWFEAPYYGEDEGGLDYRHKDYRFQIDESRLHRGSRRPMKIKHKTRVNESFDELSSASSLPSSS